MPKNNVIFIELSPGGSYVDIVGLPNRCKQIIVNSQDFSSDFYIRKKGDTEEKKINKNYEYFTTSFQGGYLEGSILQVKATGIIVIECLI